MSRKKWVLNKLNKDLAASFAEEFSIDPFAALLMAQRKIETGSQIKKFMSNEPDLIDPFLLPDMEIAVERINNAIFDYEKILVYGDYDADGVTATALLYSYLEAQGANVTYMLPDREKDGYGLSNPVVDRIKQLEIDLIITVDNGIAAISEAEYIKSLGMDLIVTDHHQPGDVLPDCIAVVNPHRKDVDCPYKDFAGVGVAFKLTCALEGDNDSVIYDYSDLVAIGTVADIVPLTSENRILVKLGLNKMNSFPSPGIEALAFACGFKNKKITSQNISFGLAPRINAAGRMESAEKALDLLLCEELETARELATELCNLNVLRHEKEKDILDECDEIISNNPSLIYNPVLVINGENWHEGVLGIVASKLLEKYLKPVIVLTTKGEVSKGSARSIDGFNLYEALSACKDSLMIFGGHSQAAGLTLKTNKISEFRNEINEYAFKLDNDFYPTISIDCKLFPNSMSLALLDSLEILEPFGAENPIPTFGLFDMKIESLSYLGENKQHLRINASKESQNNSVTLMYFNMPCEKFPFTVGDRADFIVYLDRNEWNGQSKLSVVVKDIRPSKSNDDEMVISEKLYNSILAKRIHSKEFLSLATPNREVFAAVYTYIKRTSIERTINVNWYEYIFMSLNNVPNNNICKVRVALLALEELNLIFIDQNGQISVNESAEKVDISSAPIMKYLEGEYCD
ncbi:MAG: single-stranded-DNA-specific exonuclease RecJ [Oscillospiraceae bacterium]|nr:single-stranded-DNA-specific exonuclease RecJ [Oscillospiraceae bacterium]